MASLVHEFKVVVSLRSFVDSTDIHPKLTKNRFKTQMINTNSVIMGVSLRLYWPQYPLCYKRNKLPNLSSETVPERGYAFTNSIEQS